MLPENTHPAILAEIDNLKHRLKRAREDLLEELEDLGGSLDMPADYHGIYARSSHAQDIATRIFFIAGQINTLANVPYTIMAWEEEQKSKEEA